MVEYECSISVSVGYVRTQLPLSVVGTLGKIERELLLLISMG